MLCEGLIIESAYFPNFRLVFGIAGHLRRLNQFGLKGGQFLNPHGEFIAVLTDIRLNKLSNIVLKAPEHLLLEGSILQFDVVQVANNLEGGLGCLLSTGFGMELHEIRYDVGQ
jgi:hypothetical protein